MRHDKNSGKQKSLFYREFLFIFIMLTFLILSLGCIAIWSLFNSSWRSISITFYMLLFLLILVISVGIAILYHVFFKVLYTIDNKLEKEHLYQKKHLSYEDKSFVENLIYIIDDYTSFGRRESINKFLQKQAQFDALQNQINPHFLYNTLGSISGKAYEDGSTETANMLKNLSVLFRYSMSSSTDLVPIKEELDNINNYFSILQYRFEDRYNMEIQIGDVEGEIDDTLLEKTIPKLSLQPILENAFNHGLSMMQAGGVVKVRVSSTQSRIEISISDNGKGMPHKELMRLNKMFLAEEFERQAFEASEKRSHGIALQNINARIKFSFGSQYGLQAYATPNIGTEIVMTLPVTVSEDD